MDVEAKAREAFRVFSATMGWTETWENIDPIEQDAWKAVVTFLATGQANGE